MLKAALVLLFLISPAFAHDHNKPHLNDWYKSLHSKGKSWCCDGNDVTHLDGSDWEGRGNKYRVRINGEWMDVPDEAVIESPNMDGNGHCLDGILVEQFRVLVFSEVMKIYVAGRVASDPDYKRKFAEASDRLRAQGHSVFNPAAANQEGRSLSEIMGYLLPNLCECEAIAMLPSWWRSGGARIEWLLAKYLKLKVIYL